MVLKRYACNFKAVKWRALEAFEGQCRGGGAALHKLGVCKLGALCGFGSLDGEVQSVKVSPWLPITELGVVSETCGSDVSVALELFSVQHMLSGVRTSLSLTLLR